MPAQTPAWHCPDAATCASQGHAPDDHYGPDDDCPYASQHGTGMCPACGWHDCPKAAFLDDPITVAYGVGSEMVGLIACPVCDET